MAPNYIFGELKKADSEKLIESAYHNALKKGIKTIGGQVKSLQTLHGTDGILDAYIPFDGKPRLFRLIVETKYQESFNLSVVRARALAQVIYYLKKFDDLGEQVPHVVLVGDRDECFVLHSNSLLEYLDKPYDWSIAPSEVGYKNPQLVADLVSNTTVQTACFVYVIVEGFNFNTVIVKIRDLVVNNRIQVRITERSISKVFEYFSMRILKRNSNGKSQYSAREQVALFMSLVIHSEDCYPHPKKRGIAVFNNNRAIVDPDAYASFLAHYKFDYNAEEKKVFTAICDRLLEDSDRRRKGDFYTPSTWVDEAHRAIAAHLGDTWKDDYIVWDCAWGTGNLTRDYRFTDLHCSTLHEHDLAIGVRYNQESVHFQYDFLNDDVEAFDVLLESVQHGHKLSEHDFVGTSLYSKDKSLIRNLLSKKKTLFFINPPFGTATNRDETSKKDIASTELNKVMLRDNIGAASEQLFAQFLYRILLIKQLFQTDVFIAVYAKSTYITAASFKKFRTRFLQDFEHKYGMLFRASEFADVSGVWGVDFAIWTPVKKHSQDKTVFNYELKTADTAGVLAYARKTLYNLDNEPSLSDWLRVKGKGEDAPQMTSALKWNPGPNSGRMVRGALGYLVFGGNNVYQNSQMVIIFSSCYNTGHGVSITQSNFERCCQGFTARKLITGRYATWENDKDEYRTPSVLHREYAQWIADSVIYSIFGPGANQSSLRNIHYNGKVWNVYNHFFFMSVAEMKLLALGEDHNDDIYQDIQLHGTTDRYVYTYLQTVALSLDAQAILDKARHLIRSSFKYRSIFAQEHPEYHINTWDASWYQVKGLLAQYMSDELRDFSKVFRAFEERMRPLVYELGLLCR